MHFWLQKYKHKPTLENKMIKEDANIAIKSLPILTLAVTVLPTSTSTVLGGRVTCTVTGTSAVESAPALEIKEEEEELVRVGVTESTLQQ